MSDESDFYTELDQLRVFGSTCYQPWHAILQEKFELHPSVKLMVAQHRAKDPHQLALEYPHVSEKDASRLAYTRTAADGANDRQLVTSVGKYLARHWPEVKDDLRRDVQAMYSPDTLQIFNTTPDIIRGIEDGPRSCMASIYGSIPFNERDARQMRSWFEDKSRIEPDWTKHPYSAYRPEYGWSIALRTTPAGQINGRALIYRDGDELVFLRTYRRHPTQSDGWSETDFTLQEWLKYQGYKMVFGWPEGAKLHTPSAAGSTIFAPYVDGDLQTVRYDGDCTSVFTSKNWTHNCTYTSAYPCSRDEDDSDDDDDDDYVSCDDCGERSDSDEMTWTGREGDNHVCGDCISNYTHVRGEAPYSSYRRGYREYYVDDDTAACVEGQSYSVDIENPPDSIVQLEDGDWAELDECMSIDGEYYLQGDYRVVYLQDNENLDDNYGLRADCYQVDGLWWKSEEHWAEFHDVDDDEDEADEVIEPLTTTVAAVSDERFALAG